MTTVPYAHDHDIGSLFAKARTFPFLTAEQERALAERWRETGDRAALTQLVGSHMRLAIKIASGNRGYGLPLGDLVAEGNVGLMQAAARYDPARGFRFATYAQWWIRAAIQEYILANWSLVKIGTTAAQKKLFFNLRRAKGALEAFEDGDLAPETVAAIADRLAVSPAEVVAMNRRLAGADGSLNGPVGEDGESTYQDLLADERPDQETVLAESEELRKRWALVADALDDLSPRERRILTERRLSDRRKTLTELAAIFGVSRERIRQIEENALGKLRKAVVAEASAQGLADAELKVAA